MDCDHEFYPATKRKPVSFSGVAGLLAGLVGIAACFANLVVGLLIILIAVALSATGGKRTVLVCRKCGAEEELGKPSVSASEL